MPFETGTASLKSAMIRQVPCQRQFASAGVGLKGRGFKPRRDVVN
jgi:hypothetical protein